ncbi:MAG: hypothetical protein Q8O42_09745 [Acidobacteriota bacterium]|nr:hypothetical protein [Acidobacteriota bacterium]
MPDYRKLHNGHGNSQKLAQLSDYEFRVWNQYRASADDFGVCLLSPAKLQGDNRRLAQDPIAKVMKALKRLIELELVAPFEHQGQTYICTPKWQDFEDTQYPRKSLQPVPPLEVFKILSEETQNLFRAGKRVSAEFLGFARAHARKTQTLTQTQTQTQEENQPGELFEEPAAEVTTWSRIVDAFDGSDHTRQIWLRPCRQLGEYTDRVIVGTPTDLHQEWIPKHYTGGLKTAAAAIAPGKTLTFERIGAVKSRRAS